MQFLRFMIVAAVFLGAIPTLAADNAAPMVSQAAEPPPEDSNEFKHDLEEAEKKGAAIPKDTGSDEVVPAAKPKKTVGTAKHPEKHAKKPHKKIGN